MKSMVLIGLLVLTASVAAAQNDSATVQMQCRKLAQGSNNFLESNETYVNGMACHAVAPAPAAAPVAKSEETKPPEAKLPSGPCLIVSHKNLVGRRIVWFVLTGIPIAPGANFDYVDSRDVPKTKMSYKGKDLQKLQASGVHVVVADKGSSISCASISE